MARDNITVDELNKAISGVLDEYNENVIKGVKKNVKRFTNDLVKRTKDTAPVGKSEKHYRDSIASMTVSEDYSKLIKQWYVKAPDYRLSHLLEFGHALHQGGRTQGKHFIEDACNDILPWYEEAIEEVLKNGE